MQYWDVWVRRESLSEPVYRKEKSAMLRVAAEVQCRKAKRQDGCLDAFIRPCRPEAPVITMGASEYIPDPEWAGAYYPA